MYAAFFAFVVAMLLVDLKLFHTEEHEPTLKESATWVAVWVGLAVLFGLSLFAWHDNGPRAAGEYFAGYVIEYSLSVDNMFVFVVIFAYFGVPRAYQHQVLFYGIVGAVILRGVFIALGVGLVERFEWVIYVFGAFLIYTAVKIGRGSMEEMDPGDNSILRFIQKRFRATTDYDGQKLFTIKDGIRMATPLFIVLVFIDLIDVLFAVDSIPAIFAVTRDPFIILTSNVFAILGLRAVYFLVAGGMDRLHLLRYGLAVILGFVGLKMLAEHPRIDIHVPIWLSLVVIVGVMGITAIASFVLPAPEDHGSS